MFFFAKIVIMWYNYSVKSLYFRKEKSTKKEEHKMKKITSFVLATLTAIWFIVVDHTPWLAAILLVAISIGCFSWLTSKVTKNGLWVVMVAAMIVVLRFVVLPIMAFILMAWGEVLGDIFTAVAWGFKVLGIVGGFILLVIGVLIIKNLLS